MLQRRSRGDHLSQENRIGDQSCAAMHAEAAKRSVAASRPSTQRHDLERGRPSDWLTEGHLCVQGTSVKDPPPRRPPPLLGV